MNKPQPFIVNANYLTVLRGLLEIHRLTGNGQFESDEADAIRDAMDGPWRALSDVERKRVGGLSTDLNEIIDSSSAQAALPMNPQAQGKLNQAYEARERGDSDRALDLLRRWGQYVPAPLLAYLRGMVWRDAGDAATAAVFFEHACRLEPANGNFQAMLLHVLKTADPQRAVTEAEQVIQESEARDPAAVVHAAEIVAAKAGEASESAARALYHRLIPILERTLARIEESEEVDAAVLAGMLFFLLAVCNRQLGETRRAYDYYSRAIQNDPLNHALLVARGCLVYGTSSQATIDFEQAIQLGTSIVWPYYYLAHYYLGNNRFDDCRQMCERGLRRQSSPRTKSGLYEFLAIAQAGLGYPKDVVRRSFENALRADPANDQARRNLERFESALVSGSPQPMDWERSSESSLRVIGEQEALSSAPPSARRDPVVV